jgi:hypothetical protein
MDKMQKLEYFVCLFRYLLSEVYSLFSYDMFIRISDSKQNNEADFFDMKT